MRLATLAVLVALAAMTHACTNMLSAGRHLVALPSGRQFLALVPEGLPVAARVPLVVDTPGYSESPYYQDELTGMGVTIGKYKWMAAIPFGTSTADRKGPGGCCRANVTAEKCEKGTDLDKETPCSFNAGSCCGEASKEDVNDVEFFEQIIKWFTENMCVDGENVFATGFSNGAMMTNRLACEATHLFKAVAPVAGNIRYGNGFTSCHNSKPISWISFCGDSDSACSATFTATFKAWAERNGCQVGPTDTFVSATTTCQAYSRCDDGVFVEACQLVAFGHEWPGRPRPDGTSPPQPPTNIDATAYMFDRFSVVATETAEPRQTDPRSVAHAQE